MVRTISTALSLSLTCNVVMCLSLNLFSTYRKTNDVLPTAPSPSKTILKEWSRDPELDVAIIKR